MPIAKQLIIKNGVLKVTDKAMPEAPMDPKTLSNEFDPIGHDVVVREWSYYHEVELESWKQEALVVQNPLEIKSWWYPILGNSLTHVHDGVYDAPDGLVFEVEYQILDTVDGPFKKTHKDMYERFPSDQRRQVAILSFKEPSKETDMNASEFLDSKFKESAVELMGEDMHTIVVNAMEEFKSLWIKTTDSLPKNGKRVLCYTDTGRIVENSYEEYTDQNKEWFIKNFTHWMPKPLTPKI